MAIQTNRRLAREISYASYTDTRLGSLMVRGMENASGRLGLIRRARGYEQDVARGVPFWPMICDRYGVELELIAGSLANIPSDGPCVVVANHPFGILDGLVMCKLLSERRKSFKVIAHQIFRRAQELEEMILPISFDTTREGQKLNLQTRADAIAGLRNGGCVGIFPGGTVSTSKRPFGAPFDPRWRTFTAKMIARSGAHVVPVYFEGTNSRLFQLASHTHQTLRTGLLIREFRKRVDGKVRLAIGAPIAPETLAPVARDPKAMMDLLRRATYDLVPGTGGADTFGYDYDLDA